MNFEDWEALEAPKQANDHLIGISEKTKQGDASLLVPHGQRALESESR
jgi:hypothetical protein